jgi:hypothetical protein
MADKTRLTLVRFTLFAALEGGEDWHLDAMGDRLAEQLRSEDGIVTVATEYDSAKAMIDTSDEDAVITALEKKRWR